MISKTIGFRGTPFIDFTNRTKIELSSVVGGLGPGISEDSKKAKFKQQEIEFVWFIGPSNGLV